MSLIARSVSSGGDSDFVPVPVGMHLARCYRIVDLGTQPKIVAGISKPQRTAMISFEVHGENASGKPMVTSRGEPMSISQDYNLTLHEKSVLSKHLESWRGSTFTEAERRGDGFDLKKILGVWAMINVTATVSKNGKTYHNVTGILPVPRMIKDSGLPEGFNKLGCFSMEDDTPDMEAFNSVSQYHQGKIKQSPEWQALFGEGTKALNGEGFHKPKASHPDSDMDDIIPF
jgi:hypothetical protein